MPSFLQLFKELTGEVPSLPDLYAQTLVNRAWARILDYRTWSFQIVSNAQLFVPKAISAGTCAATYNSTTVTVDAAGIAALAPLIFSNPPLASPILGIGYQIRIGTNNAALSSPTGPNYSIVAYDGAGTLTLDRPYGESTQANASFQVLKCYYSAPYLPVTSTGTDGQFARYLSITNLFDGYAITGRSLYFSQLELNSIDPQRGGQGDAYILSLYGTNSLGQPVYELYPNPVDQATYQVHYESKWPTLTLTKGPPQVSYALGDALIFQAKIFAGQWALANAGRFKDLQGTNWPYYIEQMKTEAANSLRLCIREDDEIMPSPKPFVYNGGWSFPLGGEFLQGHDLSSIIPNR